MKQSGPGRGRPLDSVTRWNRYRSSGRRNSAPTGELRAGRGPYPITMNARRLFVGIDIDHLAGSVGKGFKVELRNDEVFLLGSEAELGSDHRIQQHGELVGVVDGLQEHLNGGSEAHELVGDVDL